MHSHPGHDFSLDLEGLSSRSQLIPCAQPEGQGHSDPPASPPHAMAAQDCQASHWAPPEEQQDLLTTISVRAFYKHGR